MDRAAPSLLRLSAGEFCELAGHNRALEAEISPGSMRDQSSAGAAQIALVDRRVAEIIQRVSVPDDLRSRVLAALEQSRIPEQPHPRVRRWALGMTAAAALLLVCVSLRGLLPRPMDHDALAAGAAPLHAIITSDAGHLTPGFGGGAWPQFMNPVTIVGHRQVALFGQSVTAYQLASGNETAVLVVMPKRDFPYSIGPDRVGIKDSRSGVDVYCFLADGQACVLLVRDGVDPSRFELPTSLT